jgi:hypothetical protein
MSRHFLSVAIIMSFAAVRAEAIEMFTNFNNGQNVGLPPMEVPIGMYPGFGRGGWAPGVVGAPLRTMPPVPAMSPTGPAPMIFRRGNGGQFETGMNVRPQPNVVAVRNGRRQRFNGRTPVPAANRDGGNAEPAAPTQAEAPRGLTVLKPEAATPADFGERALSAESTREPATSTAGGINSDGESSAFFQNATSGW